MRDQGTFVHLDSPGQAHAEAAQRAFLEFKAMADRLSPGNPTAVIDALQSLYINLALRHGGLLFTEIAMRGAIKQLPRVNAIIASERSSGGRA